MSKLQSELMQKGAIKELEVSKHDITQSLDMVETQEVDQSDHHQVMK